MVDFKGKLKGKAHKLLGNCLMGTDKPSSSQRKMVQEMGAQDHADKNSNYNMKSRWSNCRNKSECSRKTPTCGKRRKPRRLTGCNLRKSRKSISHSTIRSIIYNTTKNNAIARRTFIDAHEALPHRIKYHARLH